MLDVFVVMGQEEHLAGGCYQQPCSRLAPTGEVVEIGLLSHSKYFVAAFHTPEQHQRSVERTPQVCPPGLELIGGHLGLDRQAEGSHQQDRCEKSSDHVQSIVVSSFWFLVSGSGCSFRWIVLPYQLE